MVADRDYILVRAWPADVRAEPEELQFWITPPRTGRSVAVMAVRRAMLLAERGREFGYRDVQVLTSSNMEIARFTPLWMLDASAT